MAGSLRRRAYDALRRITRRDVLPARGAAHAHPRGAARGAFQSRFRQAGRRLGGERLKARRVAVPCGSAGHGLALDESLALEPTSADHIMNAEQRIDEIRSPSQRTLDLAGGFLRDVEIDHRRFHALVTEKILDRSYIDTV